MKQSLHQIIRRLGHMSDLRASEVEELNKLLPEGDFTSAGDIVEQSLTEPRPALRALIAFLNDLPTQVLFSLAILLYAGSHDDDAFEIVDEICETAANHRGAIAVIEGKRSRMVFIERGIASIGVERLPELLEVVERKLALMNVPTDYPVFDKLGMPRIED